MTEIHFRRHARAFSAAATASALVLSGAAGCSDPGTTIARMTVGDPGPDPYAPRAGTDQRLASAGSGAAAPGGNSAGDAPGLYGGTRRTSHCDAERLVAFLRAHPDRAAAWASVQRIEPRRIGAFVARLTPVHLRSDTLVTNHGFRAGKATGAPAVLETGMGVLINEYGVPVVKCNCGNPLTPPDAKLSLGGSRYTGPSWPDFHTGKVTRIQPGRTPAEGFVLSDPNGRDAFVRPRGTQGNVDGPRVPEPPVGPAAPRATSSPKSASSPRSTFSAESHFSTQAPPASPAPANPAPAPAPPPRQTPDRPTPGTPSGHDRPAPPRPGGTTSGPPSGGPSDGGTATEDPTGTGSHRPTDAGTPPPDVTHVPPATDPPPAESPSTDSATPSTAGARHRSSPVGNTDSDRRNRP
ncbi:DUF6777 domain-containing protein [Actinomadura harenae]|uniref:DUF6777 domain-containing protein n=1 Tax=Actinomadura harenae TaxID=2483351 RepID=A0A3M2LDR0_9ACTN|nr:DUF6777 domain-containing protein [Actinomadura harenae]RMI34743.1 hypothetical protein EBO15_40405 [Actinomadura harenae]